MYGGLVSSVMLIDIRSGFVKISSDLLSTVAIVSRSFFALNPRWLRNLFLYSLLF